MYCENCGRKLKDGEVCPCRREQRKKRFNVKTIVSFLLFLAGSALGCYFCVIEENLLTILPFQVIQNIKTYLYFVIPAIFFFSGLVIGLIATKKRSFQIASRISVIANLLGVAVTIGLIVWTLVQNNRIDKLISGELTTSTRTQIAKIYNDSDENSSVQERIINRLQREAASAREAYSQDEISYEEAIAKVDDIAALNILGDELENERDRIESLRSSKTSFETAGNLEKNNELVEAINLYSEVLKEDINYEQAQKKEAELKEQLMELVNAGDYAGNIEILEGFYRASDTEIKAQIEQNALEQAENIRQEFENTKISFQDADGQLSELQKFDGISDEIQTIKDDIAKWNDSQEAYEQATELEKNEETIYDAVKAYREVSPHTPQYEDAQSRILELLGTLEENCKENASRLAEEKKYEEAIEMLADCIEMIPDNTELPVLKAEYEKEYAEYVCFEADKLIEENQYEEAKELLTMAFSVTNNQDLQEKLNSVDDYRPVSLTEIHTIDGHDFETQEEITDTYGNIHTDVLYFDASYQARAVYQLDGQYSRLSGTLVASEDTGSGASMSFAIFADDILAYSTTEFTRQTGSQSFDIDLTGVQQLEIQTSNEGEWSYGWLFVTESSLQKNINAEEPEQTYERLRDVVLIDAAEQTYRYDTLMKDSYGNLHNGYIDFDNYWSGYAVYNLDSKYANFSGKIVAGGETDGDAQITVQIYLDDMLLLEQKGINRQTKPIPFSLNVEGGNVLKIVTNDEAEYYHSGDNCYLVDDMLYFEQPETLTAVEEVTEAEVSSAQNESEIHRYEFYLLDGTWEDAFTACASRGGYLARINTAEEYDYILNLLDSAEGAREYLFYIGGRREIGSQNYQWADSANVLSGEVLNGSEAWCYGNWMQNEPSFTDSALDVEEHVMNLFYYEEEGRWVWNDVPNNLLDIAPNYQGKIGYICEYEN